MVQGGQQPIIGAEVFMFAVSTGGYGSASVSRLQSSSNTTLDSASGNYYVTTGSNGHFTVAAGDFTCGVSTPEQIYIYSLGGKTGGAASQSNSAAGLMAVIGTCTDSQFSGLPATVQLNEVSTVAAAYALAGYATDATHIAGTSTAATGIANAAANAANLDNLGTGQAQSTTAGNGAVPQEEINTLADILSACINTFDPNYDPNEPSGACGTLFMYATPNGTPGVNSPTDTATAAINIAHNPGANVGNLFGLATSTAPFQNILATAPNDWTIAIRYTGNSIGRTYFLAVDGSGNVWASNNFNGTISEFGPTGNPVKIVTGGGLNGPAGIAMDTVGDIWVVDDGFAPGLSEFDASGSPLVSGGYPQTDMNSPFYMAIDGNNGIWVANYGNGALGDDATISKYNTSGQDVFDTTPGEGGLEGPQGVAVDSGENVWVANFGNSSVSSFGTVNSPEGGYTTGGLDGPVGIAVDGHNSVWVTNVGTASAGTSITEFTDTLGVVSSGINITGGGLNVPSAVAVDGLGNVWVTNQTNPGSLSEFTGAGAAVSSSAGYTGTGPGATPAGPVLTNAVAIVIDGSGNIWVTDTNNGSSNDDLVEFVGAAAPVVTPLSVAVKNAHLGARP
jgi:hypothetical protein